MKQIRSMKSMLVHAHAHTYAVGSFSARYTRLIRPIIEAAIACDSPLIIQLSEKEILRHKVGLKEFAAEFYKVVDLVNPHLPIALHLDHTKTFSVIAEAIEVGFTSVMIDASDKDFAGNVEACKAVVALARPKGVSVEAELGRIGTTDMVETDEDVTAFTDSEEALRFIQRTGIDALAVSVGTSHGPYTTTKPTIVYSIIEDINALTSLPLVLHGGSGVPSDMMVKAIKLPSGGISKVNIATDVEQAMLKSLGKSTHMTESELNAIDETTFAKASEAVRALVMDKMDHYLFSSGWGKESL